ncbi:hypothetical protein CB1_001652029 [Camelus ferus]|nr:hypothetical protein CB1_001652029 [Camelus ferus]
MAMCQPQKTEVLDEHREVEGAPNGENGVNKDMKVLGRRFTLLLRADTRCCAGAITPLLIHHHNIPGQQLLEFERQDPQEADSSAGFQDFAPSPGTFKNTFHSGLFVFGKCGGINPSPPQKKTLIKGEAGPEEDSGAPHNLCIEVFITERRGVPTVVPSLQDFPALQPPSPNIHALSSLSQHPASQALLSGGPVRHHPSSLASSRMLTEGMLLHTKLPTPVAGFPGTSPSKHDPIVCICVVPLKNSI